MYYFKKVEGGLITSVESKSVNVASPDFVEAMKEEYDAFVASLPEPEPEPDYKAHYGKATTDKQRIEVIAKKLGLVE